MTVYPEHMDTLAAAKLKRGQLPFYMMDQTIAGSLPIHHHDFAEFSFIMEGQGTETIDGTTFALAPGTARLLLPQQIHSLQGNADRPLRLYCCMFDFNILLDSAVDLELGRVLLQAKGRRPSLCRLEGRAAAEMQALCEGMQEEYRGASFGKNSAIHARLVQALLLHARALPLAAADDGEEGAGRRDLEIIHYLNANFLRKVSLHDLAERFGLSESSVSQLIRKRLGCSFLDHLHALRLRRAASLLLTTDMSVLQLSEEAGFESVRTFTRLFKKWTGKTPVEYRRAQGHDETGLFQ